MTILTKLRWDNWFAYGKDNELDLTANNVTQLVGSNGVGKSSIPLIIEEILYSKNSKKFSKDDLKNRYNGASGINGSICFHQDDHKYELIVNRSPSIRTVTLLKDGDDISAHRMADTYKKVESILGYDHKTFCQVVYQSSTSSLEFLKTTDLQRKKFLIMLLGLDYYTELHNLFKSKLTGITADINKLKGSLDTLNTMLASYREADTTKYSLMPVPEFDEAKSTELIELKAKELSINTTNDLIRKNNQLKTKLDSLTVPDEVEEPDDTTEQKNRIAAIKHDISLKQAMYKKIKALGNKCPTCMQDIDTAFKEDLLNDLVEEANKLKDENKYLTDLVEKSSTKATLFYRYINSKKERDKILNQIDHTLESELICADDLKQRIAKLNSEIQEAKKAIASAEYNNKSAIAKNAKIEEIEKNTVDYINRIEAAEEELEESNKLFGKLKVLKDTFGPNGIVSYKIEYLIKTLESNINTYLYELSGGKFQLYFSQEGEKLNVVINNDGANVSIHTLSDGELYRVNIATLLAIRKSLTSLIGKDINILFLDEVYGVLDRDGKDRLTNILLKEKLNTFLVAHEYTHPNIASLIITKDANNISKITKGK